jgi:AcrR family transcriptional regulator
VEEFPLSTRKDSEETRRRILKAACQVFGEKGYRDATHAEICQLADVNTAAVNYHFRSKAELYRATWEYTVAEVERLYPLDGGVPADAPAPDRLSGYIRAHLQRVMDEQLGHFHRLRMMEFFNPTGLLDESLADSIAAARRQVIEILRELLGSEATEDDIELCEMSVISQCRMVRLTTSNKRPTLPWQFTAKDINRLAEHITRFSLAGIRVIRSEIEARRG